MYVQEDFKFDLENNCMPCLFKIRKCILSSFQERINDECLVFISQKAIEFI